MRSHVDRNLQHSLDCWVQLSTSADVGMAWHRQPFFRTVAAVTCHRNSVIVGDERLKEKCADDRSIFII